MLNKRVKTKLKMFWDASFHLDKTKALFYLASNVCNSSGSAGSVLAEFCAHHGKGQQAEDTGEKQGRDPWGEGLGGGSRMHAARKAAVAAGRLHTLLLIKSQFSFSTMGFPQVTNQQAVRETHKVYSVTV